MATYAQNTDVPAAKSLDEIERTLERYGAEQFAYAKGSDRAQVGFIAQGRRVLFVVRLPDRAQFTTTPTGRERADAAADAAWRQAQRQAFRALALGIKAKLELVESGIVTFEDEFAMHMVLPDGTRVSKWVQPAIAEAYETGTTPNLLAITS